MSDVASLTALEGVLTVLGEAGRLGAALTGDPGLLRLLKACYRLPATDRKVLAGLLEREAAWLDIIHQTAKHTGITVRPNPFASLYIHVVGAATPFEPSARDVEVIRVGIERVIRLVPMMFDDTVHTQWTASARALARLIDPVLGRDLVRLAREVLAIIADARPELLEPEEE